MLSYKIKTAVKGEHRIGGEVVVVDFKAGTVTPKDALEARVLEKLAALGLATEAPEKTADAEPSEGKQRSES